MRRLATAAALIVCVALCLACAGSPPAGTPDAKIDPASTKTGLPAGSVAPSGGFAPAGKTTSDKSVRVSGYTTKNGTTVAPYTRGAPGTGKHK